MMKNLSTSVLISTSAKQSLTKPGPLTTDQHMLRGRSKEENGNTSNESDNNMRNRSSSSPTSHQKQIQIFCIDLTSLPHWLTATILIGTILAGFISIGYVEEGFKFRFPEFQYGWFMTCIELIIFSMFAMIERLFKSIGKITSAVYLSSASTIHLNIPTNVNSHGDHVDGTQSSVIDMVDVTIGDEAKSLLNKKHSNDIPHPHKSKTNNTGAHKSKKHADEMIHYRSFIRDDVSSINFNSNYSKILLLFRINWMSVIFERQMDLKFHAMVATAMMCSRGLTNMALLLLNYPTQVIFKSLKLISVMMGSVFCLGKYYHKYEYIAAPLLVLSAILFTLGDSEQLNFNVLGIIVVSVSLIFDAIHANSQEYILKAQTARDTTMELLVYSNIFAGILSFFISLIIGEMSQIYYDYMPNQPFSELLILFGWFAGRVLCLYLGVSAFVVFTKAFGAVFAVTVTTIRKIMTVLLSYIFYPGKKLFLPQQHGTGTILFILSMLLWGYGTIKKKEENRKRNTRK